MALQIVTRPTAEPLDLSEVKAHARVDISDDDLLLKSLLGAARDYAENLTGKQLVAARWKQSLDSFPGGASNAPYGRTFSFPANAILLRRFPVQEVESIQYLDMQGVLQTVDPSSYVVDYSTEPVRITPVFGQVWPIPVPQIGAVSVTFKAGYATPLKADATADTISVQGWPALAVGDIVRFSNSGGALPAPLKPETDYYIQSIPSAGTYQLAQTSGGAAVDLTDTGSGTSFLGVIPEGLTAWIKIRLATIYENREEVAIMTRGKVDVLPYVDRLLDGFTVYEF